MNVSQGSVTHECNKSCVCVLSSCRLAPEATVLLIAGMDELHSQGSFPPPAAHESWLTFIKASPHLFVVRLLPQRRLPLSCSSCRIHTCFSVFIAFLYEHTFHSVKSILANCSSRFNIGPNPFYFSKTPSAPSASCSSRKRGGRRKLEETQTDA